MLLNSTHLSVHLSMCLSMHLSTHLSMCLSMHLSTHLSVCLSMHRCIPCVFLHDFPCIIPCSLSLSVDVLMPHCLPVKVSKCTFYILQSLLLHPSPLQHQSHRPTLALVILPHLMTHLVLAWIWLHPAQLIVTFCDTSHLRYSQCTRRP